MQPHDQAALLDILDQIRVIRVYTDAVTRETFLSDVLLHTSVIHWIMLIGEAATRLSDTFRTAHPEVPWPTIRAMRNFLIHVYDQVDYTKVWDTVQDDLAPLQVAVERILVDGA